MQDIEKVIPLLDTILEDWKQTIGNDFNGYKNHVTRMLNFSFYLAQPNEEEKKKLIISAAFHDIGIWSGEQVTADYIDPSIVEAAKYLEKNGLSDWEEEISLIIGEHHKIVPYKGKYNLVEIFRKADLTDFSLGLVKNGVPKEFIKAVKTEIPNEGFHKRLMQLTWLQVKKAPFNPLPMMKW